MNKRGQSIFKEAYLTVFSNQSGSLGVLLVKNFSALSFFSFLFQNAPFDFFFLLNDLLLYCFLMGLYFLLHNFFLFSPSSYSHAPLIM